MAKSEFEALAEFRYRLRCFLRFSEELTQRHGVTPLQYQLLLQIRGFPGRDWASVAELSQRLQAQHHGVVSLLNRCESAGWVQRCASPDDRRVVQVHLTAAGRSLVERLARLHLDELQSAQGRWALAGPAAALAGLEQP